MWKTAITNAYLSLKTCTKTCKRKNGMGYGNKYDDRKEFLG